MADPNNEVRSEGPAPNDGGMPSQARALRVLVVAEAVVTGVLLVLGVVYGIYEIAQPPPCTNQPGMCFDFRDLYLDVTLLFLLPMFLVSLFELWLVRRSGYWRLLVPPLFNAVPIVAFIYGLASIPPNGNGALNPTYQGGWIYWVLITLPVAITIAGTRAFLRAQRAAAATIAG